jgi:hypothetical protein
MQKEVLFHTFRPPFVVISLQSLVKSFEVTDLPGELLWISTLFLVTKEEEED